MWSPSLHVSCKHHAKTDCCFEVAKTSARFVSLKPLQFNNITNFPDAASLTERLSILINKCHANAGNRQVYSTLRKKAIEVRQQLIVQREVSGMATDQVRMYAHMWLMCLCCI